MSSNCGICGKQLSDPKSVEIGIGPICRCKAKEEEKEKGKQGDLFMKEADYSYEIEQGVLVIMDKDLGNKSVTNDMDNVIKKIASVEGGIEKIQKLKGITYKDSMGIWDGVRIERKGVGIYTEIYSLGGTKDKKEAINKIINRRVRNNVEEELAR